MNRLFPFWQELRKNLIDMGDGSFAERVDSRPSADLLTSNNPPAVRSAMVMASGRVMVDDAHSRIHQGVMYVASHLIASLADGASFNVILTTPANDWPHIVPIPSLDGGADFYIYEAPTFTGGTSVLVINQNRNSANTCGGTVVHTPTITDAGSPLLLSYHMAGGTGPQSSGAEGGFDREFTLKNSTSYLFRMTNQSGQTKRGGMVLNFYSAPLIA